DQLARPRHDQCWRVRPYLLGLPDHVEAGEVGEPKIGHDQVESLTGKPSEGRRPVGTQDDLVSSRGEERGEDVPHVGMVVDDQNLASHVIGIVSPISRALARFLSVATATSAFGGAWAFFDYGR